MTLKHALLATQRQHWLQKSQNPEPSKPSGPESVWSGLTDDEASDLSRRALQTVCLFRSVVGVQMPATLIEAELKQWWDDVGHALLFQSGPELPAEEASDGSDDEGPDPLVLDSDPAKVTSATLQGLAFEAQVKKDIEYMQKGETPGLEPAATADEPMEASTDPASSAADVVMGERGPFPNKKPRRAAKTLETILEKAGFEKFEPPEGDKDKLAIKRLQQMAGDIVKLVLTIRESEGFLSSVQLSGQRKPGQNKHNDLQHELAKAQQAYGLVGAAELDPADTSIAEQITAFRPSVTRDDSGQRRYQVLGLRLHQVGETRLGLVEQVFRGSIGRKKRAGAKPAESMLPARQCVRLHILLLSKLSSTSYQATALSEAWVVDPFDEEAPLLYQVPAEIVEDEWRVLIRLSPQAVTAALKIQGLDIQTGSDEHKPDSGQVWYTISSFAPTKSGKDNIERYMDCCRRMWEKLKGRPMLDSSGVPIFMAKVKNPPTWSQLLARVFAYFDATIRGKKAGESKAPSVSADDFSKAVYSKFQFVAPVEEAGRWIEFLHSVHSISPQVLPSA
ncbi:unnamed protein product [Symbiodinium sp. CCMP2592]|nr:unnamed protein product [Symbiodinium sp. CCMP2592]